MAKSPGFQGSIQENCPKTPTAKKRGADDFAPFRQGLIGLGGSLSALEIDEEHRPACHGSRHEQEVHERDEEK